jgi:hypothetical protein
MRESHLKLSAIFATQTALGLLLTCHTYMKIRVQFGNPQKEKTCNFRHSIFLIYDETSLAAPY